MPGRRAVGCFIVRDCLTCFSFDMFLFRALLGSGQNRRTTHKLTARVLYGPIQPGGRLGPAAGRDCHGDSHGST